MRIKVADEVWIATALLHQEQPERQSFSVGEIRDRGHKEGLTEILRPGFQVHAYLHCVANKPPNPANHRMLFATPDGNRRLFRDGDDYHPHRKGGKTHPDPLDIPADYRHLVDWYLTYYGNGLLEKLADIAARRLQRFEQELPVFRDAYEGFAPEELAEFREDLALLVALGDKWEHYRISLRLHIDGTVRDNQGEIVEEATAQLTPNVMLRAMEAWARGERFTPGALGTY